MTRTARRTIVATPTDTTMGIERTFDAPRELVWRAFTEPEIIARWWGRGNPVEIVRDEVEPGGHWRYIEHAPDGDAGFEGRYRDVTAPKLVSRTFEYDGMPGSVSLDKTELEDLGDGTTKVLTSSHFFTKEERDGMLQVGMQEGLEQSYAALDRVLDELR